MKTTFIYCLIDPRSNFVKYIGVTKKPKIRLRQHIYESKKSLTKNKKRNWILSLIKNGLRPEIQVLDEISFDGWQFWEQWYICLYKSWGFDLTNATEGGDTPYEHYPIKSVTSVKEFWQKNPDKRKLINEKIKQGILKSNANNSNRYNSEVAQKRKETIKKRFPNGMPLTGAVVLGRKGGDIGTARKVCQYDLEGNLIETFGCVLDGARKFGRKTGNLRVSCQDYTKIVHRYIWRYETPNINNNELPNTIESVQMTIQYLIKQLSKLKKTYECQD